MSAPNPAPYYPYPRRSIFGPLVLIALGVVFLLHNMGVISSHVFFMWFGRWWPLILIALGVVKLLEYTWARQKGYPPPRVGAGIVVFLVFFILFGFTTTGLTRLNWGGIRSEIEAENPDFGDFMGGFWGATYEFSDNFAAPVKPATQIKIIGGRGDIRITASQDDQAHAVVTKKIRSDSQENANKANEAIRPKFEQQGGILLLDLSGGGYQHARFDLDLELPRQTSLSVSTRRGDISVEDRDGAVDASSDNGDISVEKIKGDVSSHMRRGSFTAKNVAGNVTLDGRVNDTNISDVGGALNMTGTYWGDMQLARIAKQVHFTSSRTDLQFARLDGEFNMEPDDLRANSVVGPFKIDTRSKGIHLQDVSGEVQISNSNGTVEVRPKSPVGPVNITNNHGEIDVTMPANSGFQLSAQSLGGNIQSDYNLNVDNSHNVATATGTVGKGGPEVRLHADRGSIQIRKQ